jgi:CHAD domain-containing protein
VAGSVLERLEVWRQLVDRCGRKPTRKRVHALRVVTLRLQAELEIDLAELPQASHQAQAILRFNRLGEKLRKALGPVRELDVWDGKLDGLRGSLTEHAGYVPESAQAITRQIEKLESRFKLRRRRFEKRLLAAIDKRKDKFAAAAGEIDGAVDAQKHDGGQEAIIAIRESFAEATNDFPAFNEENLHEFRKRIKMIRYRADMHAAEPAGAQMAAQMKKVSSAIGEWHDWQEIAREAGHAHGRKSKELAEMLDAIAAEALELALATSQNVTARLLEKQSSTMEAGNVSDRKPPKRGDPMRGDQDITELSQQLA